VFIRGLSFYLSVSFGCHPHEEQISMRQARIHLQCAMIPTYAVLWFFVFSVSGYAQSILTLDQCLALAVEHSPQLQMAENAIRSTEFSLEELKTTALPQLKGVASASYVPQPPTFGYDPAISNGGQVAGQIVLQQSLYDAGMRSLKADQVQTDMERLARERRLAQQDLVLAVKQAFIEGLRAQEEVALQRQSVGQLEAYLGLAQRLYKGGTAPYTDLLKAQVQTAASRIALEKASEALASSMMVIGELIGAPLDTTTHLGGALTERTGTLPDTLHREGEADLSNNLDMSVAELLIEKSVVDQELVNHERLPEVSIFADAGYLTSGENLRLPAAERVNSLGYAVGVGIEIPILNWGATGIRRQQRELATDDLRQKMEVLRRSLLTDLRRSRLQLNQARGRLATIRENVEKAGENFLLTKSKYAVGGTLALEVLNAQQLLTETRLAELQTLADIQLLTARIERLTIQ
jgi:outer membrane protein